MTVSCNPSSPGSDPKSFQLPGQDSILPKLFVQYVRPHLDFAVQARRPWQRGDIDRLEKVQQKMVSAVTELQGLNYEDKLTELNMVTLKTRREWLDMVQTYKIVREVDDMDKNHWFTVRP